MERGEHTNAPVVGNSWRRHRAHPLRPTILFTTPYLRYPAAGGYLLGIENSIKALACIATLHIHSRDSLEPADLVSTLSYYQGICQNLHVSASLQPKINPLGFAQRAVNRIARRVVGQNLFHAARPSSGAEQDCAAILRIAAQIKPDVIWLGFGAISYPLVRLVTASAPCKVVVQADGVYSRSILRGLPYAPNEEVRRRISEEGKIKLEEEQWGTPLADVTTAVSEIEAEYYRRLAPSPDMVHRFHNVIDWEMYRDAPPSPTGLQRPCLYLAGTFWHDDSFLGGSPMKDAVRWVVRDVLPLVQRQIPNIHLYIVGANSDKVVGDVAGPGITITGALPSVLGYLCHADVALVPVRFGSGTRLKILEAGACGIPIVSTTLGAEGLPVQHEEHMLIADAPGDFAASIVRLLTEKSFGRRLATNLKTLVATRFSIPALAEEGRSVLRHLEVLGSETADSA
jgi:glycosyltransferase involved in cell wall biosynthesis